MKNLFFLIPSVAEVRLIGKVSENILYNCHFSTTKIKLLVCNNFDLLRLKKTRLQKGMKNMFGVDIEHILWLTMFLFLLAGLMLADNRLLD